MSENIIGLKPVGELLGKNFFVPSYQRGYRWTEQEVKDLLDDIYEFKKGENGGKFYCLQPLVVKKMTGTAEEKLKRLLTEEELKNLTDEGKKKILEETWYEVIDGQQRLTTIFIILKYLQKEYLQKNELQESLKKELNEILKGKSPYSLVYETRKEIKGEKGRKGRKGSKNFLENIETLADSGEAEKNIDFFHMSWAYETIEKTIEGWFKGKSEDDKEDFLLNFLLKLLNDVQFIWYESKDKDSIEVFTRLNIGKIPLTNAELIKALFLNSSNFCQDEYRIRLRQQEIASEWDNIEYTLQNKEFWLFIHNKGYENPTHIDFIFDLVVHGKNRENNELSKNYKYKTFRHFYKSFKNDRKEIEKNVSIKEEFYEIKNSQSDIARESLISRKWEDKIMKEWEGAKRIFRVFKEWFDDLEFYHYVGYLVSQKGEGEIEDLLKKWDGFENKNQFRIELKDRIWEKVMGKIEEKDSQGKSKTPEEIIAEKLDKTYEIIADCRPLLLLHNVQSIVNQGINSTKKYGMQVFYKFPFHIYKTENWNVEHIDSNTTNDLSELPDQKEWLLTFYHMVGEDLKTKIRDFYNRREGRFEDLKKDVESALNLKEMPLEDKEKDQIMNFALLDENTNKGYKNSIFPTKRRWITGKDLGKVINLPKEIKEEKEGEDLEWELDEDEKPSFVPLCTKQVFLKYYSFIPANPNYWTKYDAEAYKNDILRTLEKLFLNEGERKTK